MTSRDRDKDAQDPAGGVPWHNRTSTLLGASVAGLAAIGILVAGISYLTDGFGGPEQAPINYVGPAGTTRSSTPTTRSVTPTTITTLPTRPPITSDIDPDATTSSDAPEASTRNPETTTTRNPNLRPPRTRNENAFEEETTRNGQTSDGR